MAAGVEMFKHGTFRQEAGGGAPQRYRRYPVRSASAMKVG
jgi:hypothetical protein